MKNVRIFQRWVRNWRRSMWSYCSLNPRDSPCSLSFIFRGFQIVLPMSHSIREDTLLTVLDRNSLSASPVLTTYLSTIVMTQMISGWLNVWNWENHKISYGKISMLQHAIGSLDVLSESFSSSSVCSLRQASSAYQHCTLLQRHHAQATQLLHLHRHKQQPTKTPYFVTANNKYSLASWTTTSATCVNHSTKR